MISKKLFIFIVLLIIGFVVWAFKYADWNQVIFFIAGKTQSLKLCDYAISAQLTNNDASSLLSKDDMKEICNAIVYAKAGDARKCSLLSQPLSQEMCYSEIANNPVNETSCTYMDTSGKRSDYMNNCYYRLSLKTGDKNWCQRIDQGSAYFEKCVRE